MWSLYEDGEPVAGGGLRRLEDDVAEIKRMFVEPAARGRGHGRRVLYELEAVAVELGYRRLRLDTAQSMTTAIALYRGAGYRDIPDYNGNSYASYWGEKVLPVRHLALRPARTVRRAHPDRRPRALSAGARLAARVPARDPDGADGRRQGGGCFGRGGGDVREGGGVLFAAWCRSGGIPARIVYGTWARGRMSAHAWNEFWLEGVGWVPVDASLGWAMRHRPWNWLGQGLPLRPEAYFARLDGARIGFSYGPDVEPAPPFAPVSVEGGTELRLAGRDLTWGVETLDGGLPYLQPAYPRFTSSPVRRQDLLGRWRVAELGAVGPLVRVRNVAFGVFAVAAAASVVVDFAYVAVFAALVVFVAAAIAVERAAAPANCGWVGSEGFGRDGLPWGGSCTVCVHRQPQRPWWGCLWVV